MLFLLAVSLSAPHDAKYYLPSSQHFSSFERVHGHISTSAALPLPTKKQNKKNSETDGHVFVHSVVVQIHERVNLKVHYLTK